MKKKLKFLWCWLTGGHTYAAINLQTYRIPEKGVTCFVNHCTKCRKRYVCAVDDKALYCGTPLADYKVEDI